MIILGIDPGIAIVGYGIIEYKNNKFKVIDYGAITTPSTMNDIKRLEKIYKGIYILIKNYNIDEVAVEELFFNKNVKTAITVARCCWLWKSKKNSSSTNGYIHIKFK